MSKVLIVLVLLFPSVAFSDEEKYNCGIIPGQPLILIQADGGTGRDEGDYRNPKHYQPGNIVEKAHFTKENEHVLSGSSTANVSYVLRRYPNHHRALYSMMRNLEAGYRKRSDYSMDCWFGRAVYFAPDDEMVHMLYGIYHQRNSELKKSKEEYLKALKIKPNDSQINYNFGLLYFEMDDYKSAAKQAEVAYRNGHPLEGLRKKLQKVGITVTAEE